MLVMRSDALGRLLSESGRRNTGLARQSAAADKSGLLPLRFFMLRASHLVCHFRDASERTTEAALRVWVREGKGKQPKGKGKGKGKGKRKREDTGSSGGRLRTDIDWHWPHCIYVCPSILLPSFRLGLPGSGYGFGSGLSMGMVMAAVGEARLATRPIKIVASLISLLATRENWAQPTSPTKENQGATIQDQENANRPFTHRATGPLAVWHYRDHRFKPQIESAGSPPRRPAPPYHRRF
jgi:hypothetical protein